MPLSIENLEESGEDPCDVEENFSTKQLFSFAWQIAKGMVIIFVFWIECCWDSCSEYNLERRIQKSIFYKHEIDGINILAVFCPRRDFAQKAKSRGGILVTRAYIKESTYRLNLQSYSQYRKNLDCLNRSREESVGNDDVSTVCARKYEMVRVT